MKRLAVFIAHYSLGNSPSIVHFLNFVSAQYAVDLYLFKVSLTDAPVLQKKTIRVFDLGFRRILVYLRERLTARRRDYDRFVAFEPHGLVLCKQLFPRARPIYYSLELYLRADHSGLYYPKRVCTAERRAIHDLSGLIIQSAEKEKLFRADYGLPETLPVFHLPVTCRGPAVTEKATWLHERLGLNQKQKIALHLGGINAWFSCLETAALFAHLPDWALYFQGYAQPDYLEKLHRLIAERGLKNVFVSAEQYADLEDANRVLAAADAGLAWYRDLSLNMQTVGRSSGKIASYLRFGLPVVTNNYPGLRTAIEQPGAGICLERLEDLPDALSRLEPNLETYAAAARREYELYYRFENYESALAEFLAGQ
jgi:glycosyltransferase involved in cell wall biosynthesis